MIEYGLIGRTLAHSFSPQIHSKFGDYEYKLYPLEPEALDPLIRSRNFKGLNVTIPYKLSVVPYCDELTPEAASIGCVNTLKVLDDGRLLGHNTDIYGMCAMLTRAGIDICGRKVLILGSGGTSLTATAAARQMGAREIVIISRHGQSNYTNLHKHFDAEVIINTTPVGMYPHTGDCPVALQLFPHLRGVADVIYNPLRSQLILDAKKYGIPCANGLYMLVAQAKGASELFTGRIIDDGIMEDVYISLLRELENLILIGMPGSGKTSVGQELARLLNRQFIDTDELIENTESKIIPQIFKERGEKGFRELESAAIQSCGMRTGVVIATGGGAVLREENYYPLKQNGIVIQLGRRFDLLPTSGRPLSQGADLNQMWKIRRSRYQRFADSLINNDGMLTDTIHAVMEAYYENIGH